MHQFFNEIKNSEKLSIACHSEIIDLPKPSIGKGPLKAILLGADPTNDGIRKKPGLIQLEFVFGIHTKYEKDFFSPQILNLKAINLTKENLFIQNVCRNYFKVQTSGNKAWESVARIWLPFLKEDLDAFSSQIPVLVTADKIMKLLIPNAPMADDMYNMRIKPPFHSDILDRDIYPLYRHSKYLLSNSWNEYRTYLTKIFNE
jgi:hypothetical protein